MNIKKKQRIHYLLENAEQKVDALQDFVDNLKELNPQIDLKEWQARIDSLNSAVMSIAVVLDEPDEPFFE